MIWFFALLTVYSACFGISLKATTATQSVAKWIIVVDALTTLGFAVLTLVTWWLA